MSWNRLGDLMNVICDLKDYNESKALSIEIIYTSSLKNIRNDVLFIELVAYICQRKGNEIYIHALMALFRKTFQNRSLLNCKMQIISIL